MKLRRTSQHVDLRAFPLDGIDTFLLSRIDPELTLEDLTDVMPCPANETELRVDRLFEAGLLSVADASTAFDEALLPELGEPVLDGSEPDFLDDDWEGTLPYPSPEEPDVDPLQAATSEEALFAADPPSTLMSLFKRGPLRVAINTLAPASHAAQVTEGSNVFRRPTALDPEASEGEALPLRNSK